MAEISEEAQEQQNTSLLLFFLTDRRPGGRSRRGMLVENIRACPVGAVCAFVSAEWARLVLARAAVVSVERWSTVGWREPAGPAREVGGWRGGARVGKRCLNSGRLRIPAIRSGVGFPT
ncbi:hypothetical protein BHM03_00019614 [Ensete ventricosum]|nr:hypothetical protein BHM03_00019614 [Ensete ventricosum]